MNTSTDASPVIVPASRPAAAACPRCGLTEAELRSDGRMGCPACYDAFAALVEQAVTTLHGVRVAESAPPMRPEASPPEHAAPRVPEAPSRRAALPWPTRRAEPTRRNRGRD